MKNRICRTVTAMLLCMFIAAPAALAADETKPANVFTDHNRMMWSYMKQIILRSAEKMPEENYAFRPADSVRTYGQIVGHVADAQYAFCSVALGEKKPDVQIEKTKASKADLVAALQDALKYCDKAYDGLTDASGLEMAKLMGRDMPKLGVLNVNNVHLMEHYGNLVTYMRMKGIVPPTSEPGFGGR